MKGQKDESARLPLEVMLGHRTPDGMFVDEFVVVKPGDAAYEHAYAYAVQCYREEGEPMPYADVAGPSVSPPQSTSSDGHITPR